MRSKQALKLVVLISVGNSSVIEVNRSIQHLFIYPLLTGYVLHLCARQLTGHPGQWQSLTSRKGHHTRKAGRSRGVPNGVPNALGVRDDTTGIEKQMDVGMEHQDHPSKRIAHVNTG